MRPHPLLFAVLVSLLMWLPIIYAARRLMLWSMSE